MNKYSADSLGCIADGALGHRHIREVLADEMESISLDPSVQPGQRSEAAALVPLLKGNMSDDDSETTEAIEMLNTLACEPNIRLEMREGDLMCVTAVGRR